MGKRKTIPDETELIAVLDGLWEGVVVLDELRRDVVDIMVRLTETTNKLGKLLPMDTQVEWARRLRAVETAKR